MAIYTIRRFDTTIETRFAPRRSVGLPDELEDLRVISFALQHPVLHRLYDRYGFVLGAVFGTLFGRSCSGETKNERNERRSRGQSKATVRDVNGKC